MFILIAAVNKNGTIGNQGKMPWLNKEDFKFFKETTMGHKLVMGRKTAEGIPNGLPGRDVFVVSRSQEGPNVIQDFDQYLLDHKDSEEIIYIAGGREIYAQSLPYAHMILLSMIHDNDVVGDTLFPEFNEEQFPIVNQVEYETFTLIERKRL